MPRGSQFLSRSAQGSRRADTEPVCEGFWAPWEGSGTRLATLVSRLSHMVSILSHMVSILSHMVSEASKRGFELGPRRGVGER